MSKDKLRIIFMGTPEFAVASLDAIISNGFEVVGVITMPDKPAGRGYKLQESAVKQYAQEHGLHILQPTNLKAPSFIEELRSLRADIQVVVAFRMLPEAVWNMPKLGTFNLHASLLPQYRGAAPINWAIINGETESGITTFFLAHEIDTGKVIDQVRVPITLEDNAEVLHDTLMKLGSKLVVKTLNRIEEGNLEAMDQSALIEPTQSLKPAPKLTKENCRINWSVSSLSVHNHIRGLSPYPTAWSSLITPKGALSPVKLYESRLTTATSEHPIGSMIRLSKDQLGIVTSDGVLEINSLQLPGKKRMSSAEFLCGNKVESDWRME